MNTLRFLLATLLLAAGHALSANQPATSAQNMAASEVMDLRVEMERSPVGLDTARPRFSWKLKPQAGKRGQMQTAYRLVLGTNRNGFDSGEGRVFDSGKVESNACVLVDLLREDLQPATDYHWTVKVWDENGLEGGFAPIAKFATGYFDKKFWDKDGAMWIESPVARRDTESVEIWIRHACSNVRGTLKSDAKPGGLYDRYRKLVTDEEVEKYARDMSDSMKRRIWSASLLRKEFSVAKVAKARLYICGLGYYRAYLNGKMVGDRVLAPSDSDFFANAYYNVFDVTDQINKKSENCLGIELATGRWWSSPGNFPQQYHERPVVIARLELTDSNGQTKAIVTDTTWQAGEHGILRSSFWIGELFDANRYPQGWDTPGFNASEWLPAKPAGKYPQGEMLRDPMPPECIVEYCDPVAVSEPLPGIYVYDFGKQITGRVKLQLDHLTQGQEIVLRYAEIKTGDAPNPVPTALAWYPDFNNDRQLPGMLQFKRRGSVASEYPLWYGGKDGRERGSLGSYQIGGGHLYTDMGISGNSGKKMTKG
ncbi:MAG: alpha-L-rhamnosidase N-terminal domain-containing protein [Verrucomicrobia bacterium]|jgi:alpha-L-rhamnosidase|nr:alpha-L-rhamnosidase N-terminal domain-containing protein [Verrucomicrobiota bacterium]